MIHSSAMQCFNNRPAKIFPAPVLTLLWHQEQFKKIIQVLYFFLVKFDFSLQNSFPL